MKTAIQNKKMFQKALVLSLSLSAFNVFSAADHKATPVSNAGIQNVDAPVPQISLEDSIEIQQNRRAQTVANEFAYRAVNNVGCSNFASYFQTELLPRLESLKRRNFDSSFMKNLIWDYSEKRFKSFGSKYQATTSTLILLTETYLKEGFLSQNTIAKIVALGPEKNIQCTSVRPENSPANPPALPPTPTPAATPTTQAAPSGGNASTAPLEHDSYTGAPLVVEDNDHSTTPTQPEIRRALPVDPPIVRAIVVDEDTDEVLYGSFEEVIRESVDEAFQRDPTCARVFTGNGRTGIEDTGKSWALTLARSFANDLCAARTPELDAYQSQDLGQTGQDALGLSHFRSYMDRFNRYGNDGNKAATYTLLYTHGLRESGGNFSRGRDLNGGYNTLSSMETGAFQVASGTLNGQVIGLQSLFRSYTNDIQRDLSNDSALIKTCGLEEINSLPNNATQTKHLDHIRHLFGKNEISRLALITSPARAVEFNACGKSISESTGELYLKRTTERANCFIGLQKACPALAIKYNSMMIRGQRQHFGPLWTHEELRASGRSTKKYQKAYPQPACGELFETILQRKNELCRETATTNPSAGNTAPTPSPENPAPAAPTPNHNTPDPRTEVVALERDSYTGAPLLIENPSDSNTPAHDAPTPTPASVANNTQPAPLADAPTPAPVVVTPITPTPVADNTPTPSTPAADHTPAPTFTPDTPSQEPAELADRDNEAVPRSLDEALTANHNAEETQRELASQNPKETPKVEEKKPRSWAKIIGITALAAVSAFFITKAIKK